MLQLRSTLILAAVPAGLVLGALAWLVFGGSKPVVGPVQSLDAELTALDARPHQTAPRGANAAAQVIAAPIFAVSTLGPAVPDVAVKLLGLARTPAGSRALLSINNAPAEWISVGAGKDGITLQEVTASKVVIDTPGGTREVSLGETSAPSPAAAASSMPSGPSPLAGYRLPPAPANAPGMHQ